MVNHKNPIVIEIMMNYSWLVTGTYDWKTIGKMVVLWDSMVFYGI